MGTHAERADSGAFGLRPLILFLALANLAPPLFGDGDRSRILVALECSSQLAHEDITIFANGTVRVRQRQTAVSGLEAADLGQPLLDPELAQPPMVLGELGPDELSGFLDQLAREDLTESEERFDGAIAGDWIEVCSLTTDVPGSAESFLTFGRFDSLSLGTSRVVKLIRALADRVELSNPLGRSFPDDYAPRHGDVLERGDGSLFTVVRMTDDGLGIELEGLRQPITLILSPENLPMEFLRLVRREPRFIEPPQHPVTDVGEPPVVKLDGRDP